MINPIELRIGNYVNYEQTTHVISELGKGLVVHYWKKRKDNEEYVSRYDELKPIELTPEILEKSGFEIDLPADIYKNTIDRKTFYISFYDGDVTIVYSSDIGCQAVELNADITYFHQLQNLYFALTGEELSIS